MKKVLLLAITAALAVTVAACGGGSDGGSAGETSGGETTAATGAAGETSTGGGVDDALRQTLACDDSPTPDSLVDYAPPKANEPYEITLMEVSLAGYYYQAIKAGAEEAAGEAGVKLTTLAAEGYASPELQLQQVENAIQGGTDAIILAPSDIQGSVPVVEKATEAGIPVINISTEVASPDVYQVMQDDYILGQLGADQVAAAVGEDGGRGIIIAGPANATWSRKRTVGFMDRIAEKYPNIEVVAAPTQLVDPAAGLQSFENAIQSDPEIDWIYSVHYFILQPKSIPEKYRGSIPYVSNGYEPDSITALEDGSLHSVYGIEPMSMGKVGVGEAVALLNGDTVPKVTCIPAPVFTQAEIGSPVADAELIPGG